MAISAMLGSTDEEDLALVGAVLDIVDENIDDEGESEPIDPSLNALGDVPLKASLLCLRRSGFCVATVPKLPWCDTLNELRSRAADRPLKL